MRFAVPVVLLVAILRTIDWQTMGEQLVTADVRLLGTAGAMLIAAVLIQAQRWQVLLESNGEAWPRPRVLLVHYAAMFFDLFLPGKLGSDVYRVAMIRRPGRLRHLIVTVVALRLHGMAACILVAVVAGATILGLKHGRWWIGLLGVVVLAAAVAVVFVLDRLATRGARVLSNSAGRWRLIGQQYADARAAFLDMLRDGRTLGRSCAWIIANLATVIGCYWAAGSAFGMTLPLSSYVAVAPLLVVMSALPITIQGRGVTELMAILAWEGARATREQIVLACFAVYALAILQGLTGGVVLAFLNRSLSAHPAYDVSHTPG